MAEIVGQMQGLMEAMTQAIQPPPPVQTPPPLPPLSPATRAALVHPLAPSLEGMLAQLLQARQQGTR